MKCSISGCSNTYENKSKKLSFHGFPSNPKILTAWVAATGTPDFIPTNGSKICGVHFEESAFISLKSLKRQLKPEAVPTKFLDEDATIRVMDHIRKENCPMACILDSDASMKQVLLKRDQIPTPAKSIIVSKPADKVNEPIASSSIKLVDVNKLLQPQPLSVQKGEKPASGVLTSLASGHFNYNPKSTKYPPVKSVATAETFLNRTGVTTSQVLTCLKVILPGTFDLSRMIPNEKVSSLVIRYLKLDDKNEELQKVVKEHLRIIVEAVKRKDKPSFTTTNHPYSRVTDRDLKRALSMILPENFSMIDITDELLGLICSSLNIDIHTDAYYILIGKIRKFTSEGQKFNEILNCGNPVYDSSLEVENDTEVNSVEGNVALTKGKLSGKEEGRFVFVDVNRPVEKCQKGFKASTESAPNSTQEHKTIKASGSPSEIEVKKGGKCKKKNSDRDSDWEIENLKPESLKKTKVEVSSYLQKLTTIVAFLHTKKCSAKDALENYRILFDLCRHLQMKHKNSNVRNVKVKLNYILENNINLNNIRNHIEKLTAEKFPQELAHKKSSKLIKIENDKKLKMKPVVVLQDLIGFESDQMLFMKRLTAKSNGFYKQIPFSLKQASSDQKFTSEQVRKLTDNSYKKFRRIVLQRNGTKGIFKVKYIKLSPGTVVYAKNFRHPGVGWVRGVVDKPEGRFRYQVKLDNNCLWCCTVDQLRPVLNVATNTESKRTHRPIKPKQMFDL